MPSGAELTSHTSLPESCVPARVQRIERPEPLVLATSLAFLRFEKPDLAASARFLTDFGLETVASSDDELILRGAGSAPCVVIARLGPKPRFVGTAFVVPNDTDLNRLAMATGARQLDSSEVPGGADGIELIDPAGHALWLISNWRPVPTRPVRSPLHEQANAPGRNIRVNVTVRPPVEPATVIRLGHLVLQTANFPLMAEWYMRHLGLIPTDVQYLPDGSPALTFFRLNLGDQPADHHSFVLVAGIEEKFEHSAYEVVDLDAVGQGHQILRAHGHRPMWGIGRHILGSQIFDYWFDPDGFQFEHYADGDMFTADYEPRYSPFEPGSIWAWGDDAPAAMRGKPSLRLLTDAVKALASGRISFNRLKLLGKAMSRPARPWL